MKVQKSQDRLITDEYTEIEIVQQNNEDYDIESDVVDANDTENDENNDDDTNVNDNYDDNDDSDDDDEDQELDVYYQKSNKKLKIKKKLVEVTPPQGKRRYDIMKLIRLYRKNECLWNVHTKQYKRIDLKNKTYSRIAQQIGITVDELKRKIKNLRTAYLSAKKKSQSGYGADDDDHQPTLFYFNQMSFLDSCIINRMPRIVNENQNENRKTSSTSALDKSEIMNVCKFETDQIEESVNDGVIDDEEPTNDNHNNTNEQDDDVEEEETYNKLRKKIKLSKSPPPSPPQTDMSNFFDVSLEKIIKALSTNIKDTQNYNDEFDCFGQSIAAHLRKMPITISLDCMLTIQGNITKARLKAMEKN